MKKLERLKLEAARVKMFYCLPPQMKQMLEVFYLREIDAIEKYGADNPDIQLHRPKKEERKG